MNKVKSLRKFKNERTTEQTLDYMASLVRAGVDMFDVDLGCYDNWWLPHPPGFMPPGCFWKYRKSSRIISRKTRFFQRRHGSAGSGGGATRLS